MPPPLALSLHPPSLLSPPQVCTVPLRALPPPPRSGRISLPPALPLRTHLRNPRPAPRVASCFAASRHGPGPGGRCGALAPAAPRRGRRPSCGGHLRRHGEEQWRTRRRRRRTEEAEGDPSVRGRLVPDRLHFRRRRSGFDSGAKRFKSNKSNDNNGNLRTEAETDSRSAGKAVSKNPPAPEPPKQDYIHVRARRGQATDSHSLAERARREKISERMKVLQDLVPGCNKVIGKASVLDEIINYIQSLQCQVEFLSMKLEAFNAHPSNVVEAFPSKDFASQTYSTAPGLTFDTQTPREYGQGTSTSEWLHMQIGGAYERVS
ncbi:hypothetical protein PAHAL_9G046300 [Panicum hallii]|uniref:BHLH domain-containing protein n=1 Tax=Panicum hallii TaxID=206008 RepID=A0A2T8I0C1_9POAL|nr:hypothetical protein PAHAL_9G046300 [Panicum hallii]